MDISLTLNMTMWIFAIAQNDSSVDFWLWLRLVTRLVATLKMTKVRRHCEQILQKFAWQSTKKFRVSLKFMSLWQGLRFAWQAICKIKFWKWIVGLCICKVCKWWAKNAFCFLWKSFNDEFKGKNSRFFDKTNQI